MMKLEFGRFQPVLTEWKICDPDIGSGWDHTLHSSIETIQHIIQHVVHVPANAGMRMVGSEHFSSSPKLNICSAFISYFTQPPLVDSRAI